MHTVERLSPAQLLLRSPSLTHLCAAGACNSSLDLFTCSGMRTHAVSHRACGTNKTVSTTIRSCFKTTHFCIVHGRDPPTVRNTSPAIQTTRRSPIENT